VVAFSGARRTQPCDAGLPRFFTSVVPWMAYPPVKKTACGIGAFS
jgi:hypothetical protein